MTLVSSVNRLKQSACFIGYVSILPGIYCDYYNSIGIDKMPDFVNSYFK